MQYSFNEIQTLNLLSDNPDYSKRFNTPVDLRVMTGIILVVIFFAVTCAFFFKVDKIVPAQGVLDTQAKLFQVRSPISGLVKALHVEEGTVVSPGDVLMTFDSELMVLEISRLQHELSTLGRAVWTDYYQIREWLDQEALNSLNHRIQKISNPIKKLGYKDYLERSLSYSLATLDQALKGLEDQQRAIERQINLVNESMKLEETELARLLQLRDQGVETQHAVDFQRRAMLNIKSNLESLISKKEDAKNHQKEVEVERAQLEDHFILERLLRLQDQSDKYFQTSIQLESKTLELKDMTIRAPFDATVDNVFVLGQQEAIEVGATLIELRPKFEKRDLKIDILIPSNYAIWVESGMEFRASAVGNNPEDHGRIHGNISFVSESSDIIDGNRMYRMTGTIARLDVNNPETFLRPGLQLRVEIKAGKRRLINYLFDPFSKHLRNALTEPS